MMKSRHHLFFRAVPKKCGAKVPQNWISELMKLMKLMKLSSRKRVPFDTGLATFRKKKGAHFSRKQKEITYGLDSWPSSLFRSGCFGVEGFLPKFLLIFSHFLLWKFPKNFPTRLLQREQWTLVVRGSKHFIHGMEGSGKDLQCRQTWNMKKKHRAENYPSSFFARLSQAVTRKPLTKWHKSNNSRQMVMSNLQLSSVILCLAPLANRSFNRLITCRTCHFGKCTWYADNHVKSLCINRSIVQLLLISSGMYCLQKAATLHCHLEANLNGPTKIRAVISWLSQRTFWDRPKVKSIAIWLI